MTCPVLYLFLTASSSSWGRHFQWLPVQPLWWGCMGSMSTSWKSLAGGPKSLHAVLLVVFRSILISSNLICWCVYVYPSLHIDQVRRSLFFFQNCLHFTYSIRYTGVDVHESMNPSLHVTSTASQRGTRHARSPRWAPAEGPAIHQDLGMECPLKKEGFSYTYVWNYLKSWWYLCGAHRFCELLWHFFGLKFVLIDQVEPHLVESPHRPTSESVCFRLLAERCFFITYSMATFSNIVISSEPQFPFHPKHPGGAWSLQVMSSQLGKTQRFVLGQGITSSFCHGTWEVHGLGKQKSLTSLNFGTLSLCFGACKSWRATRCCRIFSTCQSLQPNEEGVTHLT